MAKKTSISIDEADVLCEKLDQEYRDGVVMIERGKSGVEQKLRTSGEEMKLRFRRYGILSKYLSFILLSITAET